MTSLTFQMTRALAPLIGPGDEILVTRMDHDANVTPLALFLPNAPAPQSNGSTSAAIHFAMILTISTGC